jgi:hypothetical protein
MKLVTSVALALILAAPLGLAKDKKKNDLPAVFSTARFVYVQAEDGDIMNPRLFPEDREAIADVEDALHDWNRYAVAIDQSDAELVMVVRKGKVAGAQVMGGVGVGTGPQYGGSNPRGNNPAGTNNPGTGRTTTTEIGARGEIGPPDDMLRVYIVTPDGRRGAMVWSGVMKDGLNAPGLILLRQLRQEIDHSYPPQTATKKP